MFGNVWMVKNANSPSFIIIIYFIKISKIFEKNGTFFMVINIIYCEHSQKPKFVLM